MLFQSASGRWELYYITYILEEIDLKKIKPERSMAEMPDEEVAVINRLQFDEMQKNLGKPQSHELKVHDMLKQGWDAEGSPFKGQKFDPKMFDIQKNAVQMWFRSYFYRTVYDLILEQFPYYPSPFSN